ncbi:MAG: hypothetical protein FWC50_08555, partial [Planctomycetaceae bacterium]|nr:hypothetical protein [Planctomycetaceae bacterium]
MSSTVPFIDMLFNGFAILQLAALLFFGIAILLRRLTPEPVERIRITMTAFVAILVMFVTIMIPFAPRWSIAVWREHPTVSLEHINDATNQSRDSHGAVNAVYDLNDATNQSRDSHGAVNAVY